MVVRSSELVWHDLECGSYRADLPLWRELADATATRGGAARVLDVGAGSGRVALDLARAGHVPLALDLDGGLLGALRERDEAGEVETVCADARTFELHRDDFDLCLLPMQTVQLLGGSAGRMALLSRARAHLRPGGMLALAIVTQVEPFDAAHGDIAPSAEIAHVDGAVYLSRTMRVSLHAASIVLERERRIVLDGDPGEQGGLAHRPSGSPGERVVVELDRVDASELEREAIKAGLYRDRNRELAPTEEHVGGTVVVLRA